MRQRKKHVPKNCKWPLEISPLTGLPKEYSYATGDKRRYNKRWILQRALDSNFTERERRKKKKLHWRDKLWVVLTMEQKDEVEAAKYAYGLDISDNSEKARKFAFAISSRNKKNPLVREYAQDIATEAGKTIIDLSKNADKDSVRLAAAIDILDRLGFKAPEKIEIDDKRELTDEDNLAISNVISILHPKVSDAEIVSVDSKE